MIRTSRVLIQSTFGSPDPTRNDAMVNNEEGAKKRDVKTSDICGGEF